MKHTYVKTTCPSCHKVVENWHRNDSVNYLKIGYPFIKCPYCGTLLYQNDIAEYIMLINPKKYVKDRVIDGTGLFIIVSIILLSGIYNMYDRLFHTDPSYVLCVISFLSSMTLLYFLRYSILKKQIAESLNRTSDSNYRDFLYNHNLIPEDTYNKLTNRIVAKRDCRTGKYICKNIKRSNLHITKKKKLKI